MDTLGKRIELALTGSNVSVNQAAAACDVSVQAIYTWMRDGVKDLRNENLFALADLTGYQARWIATGKGPQKLTEGEREKRLLEIYGRLDERGRAAVHRVAEAESAYAVSDLDNHKDAA